MTPEYLREIEELYHAAREDRNALASADPELRLEVESLLKHEADTLPTLDIGDAPEDGEADSAETMVAPGTQLGFYIIESQLGAGGMGVVFRARDTRLNRPVAVKVLLDGVSYPGARRRFQREVRMASSLNHPHILTVHDTGEYEGRQYLVTELVDGGTLKDWVNEKKRTWREIVELLVGVAEGLAAAHGAGILHRDIKPANILVATNGYAKLADFGVATLSEKASDNASLSTDTATQTGIIVGSIAYMSPEQISGRTSDARSDIFSFGVVLYEMLAGRRPFAGETQHALLQAIMDGTPAAPPADLPLALCTTLEKTLEKDPADRYQTARDLVVDLRRATRHEVGLSPVLAKVIERRPAWQWVGFAAALVSIAAVFGWAWRANSVPENPLANSRFTRLTGYEGAEIDAAISPDGKFIAFLSDRDGHFHAWLNETRAGKSIDLTPGPEDQRAPLRSVGFSGDGSAIWLAGTETRKIRLVPIVGGEPRVFLGDKVVSPVWSPEGDRIVYHTLDAGDPIFIADSDGANAHQIFKDNPDRHNHFLAWGREGWIYFVHGTAATKEMDLWRIRASGGPPERLTQINSDMRDPVPLGDATVLYIARDIDGSGPWIWAYDIPRKTSRRITFGVEEYTSLSASTDGKRLAATVANPKVGLWTVPILKSIAGEHDVKPFALPSARSSMPRFRGNALYYLASQGAGDGLWRLENGKAAEIWRGTGTGLEEPPAVSPDGLRIAIVIRTEGKRRLRVISADGAESTALAPEIDVEGSADWSPDGRWVVTGGKDGKGPGLFKIPVAGGASVRLTNNAARNPVWSPDGSLIAYSGPNVFTLTPLLAVRPDGTPVEMPPIRTHRDGERLRFLPNGGGLIYMQGAGATPWQDFWLLDLNTKKTSRLTQFDDAYLRCDAGW
jgi:serine/threonine protein kinase/Tol biopolymer transport system component